MTNEPFISVPIVTDNQGIALMREILQSEDFWDHFQVCSDMNSMHHGYV